MTLRKAAISAALAVATGLSACATATPYQPNIPGQAAQGGFSEQQLESDRFRVNFAGNSLTSRETVEGYLLFRAAELTVNQGYDYFVIVDRDTDRKSRTYVEPDPFYRPYWGTGFGYWRPHWRYYGVRGGWRSWSPYYGDPFFADRVDVRTVDKYEANAEIQMRRGRKPDGDPGAFDARAVMDAIRPRLQLPT